MIDFRSETWLDTKKWAFQKLRDARSALEAQGCDPRVADELRGTIALAQQLLQLETPKAPLSEPAAPRDRSGY